MERFKTRNNIEMIRCYPLNWEIDKKYAITKTNELNPEFYIINVGSLDEMWQCSLIPETMVLSFCSMHYSKDEVYRFKVETIEEASEMVLKFAKGMGRVKDLEGTIYLN